MLKIKKKYLSSTERENKLGVMGPSITEIGEMEWLRVKVHFTMQMAMFILVNSTKTARMDLEFTFILTVRGMKAFGKMTTKMDLEKKS